MMNTKELNVKRAMFEIQHSCVQINDGHKQNIYIDHMCAMG